MSGASVYLCISEHQVRRQVSMEFRQPSRTGTEILTEFSLGILPGLDSDLMLGERDMMTVIFRNGASKICRRMDRCD